MREKRHAARRAARTAVSSRFVVLPASRAQANHRRSARSRILATSASTTCRSRCCRCWRELTLRAGSEIARAAVVVDVREGKMLDELPGVYKQLKEMRSLNPV